MKRKTIRAAVEEARSFLKKAEVVLSSTMPDDGWITGSKETGALRRSSLDLTRALAELRNRAA